MRIAMIGVRGVPANYGGLEECAEEVGARLAERGHEVIVYCRRGTYDNKVKSYRGMRRIVLPRLKGKVTDTYSHTLLSLLHVLTQKPDVILAFNPGVASLCLIPRLFGYRIALNPDGFDWRRDKWGPVARHFIHASAWLCARITDQMIIDAVSVCDYYNETFDCQPPAVYIPNGAVVEPAPQYEESDEETEQVLNKYGLEKQKYLLFLSRHEPENSCEYVLAAFEGLDTDVKLLFGGSAAYRSSYAQDLRRRYESHRIIFTGGIYDQTHVKILHHNCYFVIHGNQVGGTSLGLLKAIGLGTCVVTLNTKDNAYVVDDADCLYDLEIEDLRDTMQLLLDKSEVVLEKRAKVVRRAEEEYLWDVVTDKYEAVLSDVAVRPRRRWFKAPPDRVSHSRRRA